ncbi:MAG: hypothetical protein NT076_01855 [Candidatus Pacearchaeota archaeon]|nr:hypothetical protein [Candidatus Pacearchaeota archaeon]
MIKNKKADLTLTEGAKLILAVICIGLLILFAVMLYNSLSSKQEREQAQATLEQLTGQMQQMKEGEVSEFLITSPIAWSIVYFNKNLGDSRPKSCIKDKNCLCICQESDIKDCQKGVCKSIDGSVIFKVLVDLTDSSTKNLLYEASSGISFKTLPLALGLTGIKGGIELSVSSHFIKRTSNDEGKITDDFLKKTDDVETNTAIEFFNSLLNYQSDFLDKGKITIKEQLAYYYSNKANSNAEKTLFNNIKTFYSNYDGIVLFQLGDSSQSKPILFVISGKNLNNWNDKNLGELSNQKIYFSGLFQGSEADTQEMIKTEFFKENVETNLKFNAQEFLSTQYGSSFSGLRIRVRWFVQNA